MIELWRLVAIPDMGYLATQLAFSAADDGPVSGAWRACQVNQATAEGIVRPQEVDFQRLAKVICPDPGLAVLILGRIRTGAAPAIGGQFQNSYRHRHIRRARTVYQASGRSGTDDLSIQIGDSGIENTGWQSPFARNGGGRTAALNFVLRSERGGTASWNW